jgi:hypothetical protein
VRRAAPERPGRDVAARQCRATYKQVQRTVQRERAAAGCRRRVQRTVQQGRSKTHCDRHPDVELVRQPGVAVPAAEPTTLSPTGCARVRGRPDQSGGTRLGCCTPARREAGATAWNGPAALPRQCEPGERGAQRVIGWAAGPGGPGGAYSAAAPCNFHGRRPGWGRDHPGGSRTVSRPADPRVT